MALSLSLHQLGGGKTAFYASRTYVCKPVRKITVRSSRAPALPQQHNVLIFELGCIADCTSILVEAGYRAAMEMWPGRLTEDSGFFVQKAHSLISLSEPSDIVFWVRCIQDEVLTGRSQRAQGNRRTRPLRLTAISQLFSGEEEDLVTVAVLRWSLEEGISKDYLVHQARRHFDVALRLLALAAATHASTPAAKSPGNLDCCRGLQPYVPIAETVKQQVAAANSNTNSSMSIVSPVLPHALAAYVLQRCGLGEAVSMLAANWEQGIMQAINSSSSSSSSIGSSSSREVSTCTSASDNRYQAGIVAHLFTPNLAHAQKMAKELANDKSISFEGPLHSREGEAAIPSSSSFTWRDTLERSFRNSPYAAAGSDSTGSCKTGDIPDAGDSGQHVQEGGSQRGQSIKLAIHLAEWACPSQPSRAKALGQEGLHLTDEVRLAEMAGCSSSRAVMDGIEW